MLVATSKWMLSSSNDGRPLSLSISFTSSSKMSILSCLSMFKLKTALKIHKIQVVNKTQFKLWKNINRITWWCLRWSWTMPKTTNWCLELFRYRQSPNGSWLVRSDSNPPSRVRTINDKKMENLDIQRKWLMIFSCFLHPADEPTTIGWIPAFRRFC